MAAPRTAKRPRERWRSSLPTWGYSYRSVWIQGTGPGGNPELEHEVHLTLHGLAHLGGPVAEVSVRAPSLRL